jgi:hypothetical protein
MATPPDFTSGAVLTAAQMNAVGLWLVKTQDVGAVAVPSVTVTGAFSADYDNYLILLSGGTGSAAASIGIEIGGSGTGYYGFMTYGDATTNTVQGAGRNNTALLNWVGGVQGAGQAAHVSVQVIGPFKAAYTKFLNGVYQNANVYGTMQGEHRVATSYTSFKLVPDAGTISNGTVYVYGYKGTV